MKEIKKHILFVAVLLIANHCFAQGNINVSGGSATINMVNNVFLTAHDIKLQPGNFLVVNNSWLQTGGSITSSGTLDITKGTIEMNGSLAQTVAGSMFYHKTIRNLVASNTGTALSVSPTAGDTLKIKGTLSFGRPFSILNTGNNITLLSDSNETANVGIVGIGNSIIGKATVERYIHIGPKPGQHAKSWQLLSTSTTGQTIREAWMEGGLITTTPNGYGTWTTGGTGVPGGFDVYSATPSMKTYNSTINNWTIVPNPTTTQIHNANGYMIFIRGDRSVFNFSGANSSPENTILRNTGNLLTGDQPEISLPIEKYQTIGNPYASAIDFTKITKTPGVDNKYYVWDPYLHGTYGLGGYQTISSATLWKPIPGGTPTYPSGISSSTIQSGQAFFVYTTGLPPETNYTLSFSENAKISEPSKGSFARPMAGFGENKRSFFGVSLYTGSDESSAIADGNMVAFDELFSNEVDGDDALKIINDGENFGLKRNGILLSVEARKIIENTDTIYYSFSKLKQQNYQLRFAPKNLESSGLEAFLVDQFLLTETPVNLVQNSEIDITITGAAGSSNSERFHIIFRPMAALPVTFTSIIAYKKEADIQVEWKVENQSNLKNYVVEKSLDGIHFNQIAIVQANNGTSDNYNWLDKEATAGNNYYRVHSVDLTGIINYTRIVKVITGKDISEISVYPNPVTEEYIQLHLINQPSGVYKIRVENALGQVVLTETINHSKNSGAEKIKWNNKLAKGTYQLIISNLQGEVQVVKLVN